ncbi:MAG: hypothetical protein RL522_3117 [Pseudomonadota bacterium]|jgi:hypothetical protein
MPNWVYNTLRVKGTKKRLTQLAWAIGSPSAALDWTKLAGVIPLTWDARDERSTGELEVDGRDLVYRFNTAWNPRPQLVEDLAARYPDLGFELHYVEEGPAFAGAAVFAQGRKVGEAYLGDGEERAFFEPYDEDEYDGEWDYDGMTASLLERARAGETIDWDARRKQAAQARKAVEQQAANEAGEQLQQAVARIQGEPALRKDPKRRNEILIPLASRTGPGLGAIPKAWWNDDLLVAFLLQQYEQAKLIPAALCTETLVDKLLAVQGQGYAGLYPIPSLKVGLRNERQALAYVKQAPGSLGKVPRALRTARVCEQAVRGDGEALEHVPKALRTAALCDAAVANKGAALAFVPAALKTAQMCKKAVRPEAPNALKFVPAKFLDEALLKVAMDNTHSWMRLELGSVNSAALRRKYLLQIIAKDGWSSIKVMTDREHAQAWGSDEGRALLCKLLEDDSLGLLDKVPVRFHTPEILAAAGQHSALANFEFVPERYKTRELCLEAIEDDHWGGKVLRHVPMPLRDRSVCALSLNKAVSGPANTFRTEGFENELLIWFKGFEEGDPAASVRAHVSSCFVESEFPDSVWDAELVARSLDSSPYAVLFVPRRHVTQEALLQVVRNHFAMYLVLEAAVARELAPQAVAILRDFVGERAWALGAKWQSLEQMLQSSEPAPLIEALGLHAVRWFVTQFSARVLARTMEGLPDDSGQVVEALLATRQQAAQMFPECVGRTALSQDECHRLLFACDQIPTPA